MQAKKNTGKGNNRTERNDEEESSEQPGEGGQLVPEVTWVEAVEG